MYTLVSASLAVAQSSVDDGLTLREVVESLPSDPASIFVLLLLSASVAFVAWSGRGRKGGGGAAP